MRGKKNIPNGLSFVPFGTDNDFNRPAGTGLFSHDPRSRHFVPGYYQPVPPRQKPSAHRRGNKTSQTSLNIDASFTRQLPYLFSVLPAEVRGVHIVLPGRRFGQTRTQRSPGFSSRF